MTDDELDERMRASLLAEKLDTSRVAAAVREQIQTRPRHVPAWAVAAAAVIAMVAASALSYRAFVKEKTPPLCIAAAQDHEREIVNGESRPWLSDQSSIRVLAAKQGVPESAIAALDSTGYRLERGRLCFLKKQIYLHLVYTKDGDRFSVYLRPRGSESLGSSVQEAEVGGEDTAYFESHQLTAVFVAHHSNASTQAGTSAQGSGNVLAFARAGAKVL